MTHDITGYSDDELSLRVFNDPYFYIERHQKDYFWALVDEEYRYTAAQRNVLQQDLDDDLEEMEKCST
jgi:hypothetical protein